MVVKVAGISYGERGISAEIIDSSKPLKAAVDCGNNVNTFALYGCPSMVC